MANGCHHSVREEESEAVGEEKEMYRGICIGLVMVCAVGAMVAEAGAELIGLQQQYPTIFASFTTINYDASGSTGLFQVRPDPLFGDMVTLTEDEATGGMWMDPSDFLLDAEIDKATGRIVAGGINRLKITGDVDFTGEKTLFYSTQIQPFGSMSFAGVEDDLFEFCFVQEMPDDGSEANLLVPVGTPIGVTISFSSSFSEDVAQPFAESFSDYSLVATASAFPIKYGDLNADGFVNTDDINPFIAALIQPDVFETIYPTDVFRAADVNEDLNVNTDDINSFVALVVGGGSGAPVPEPGSYSRSRWL